MFCAGRDLAVLSLRKRDEMEPSRRMHLGDMKNIPFLGMKMSRSESEERQLLAVVDFVVVSSHRL